MSHLQDVVVVHSRGTVPEALWSELNKGARSVETLEAAGSIDGARVRHHSVLKVCIFWLADAEWQLLRPEDPEAFLDKWGSRCGRLVVVETMRQVDESAGVRLVNYDHAQTISVVMFQPDGDHVMVFGFHIDCVRQRMAPTLLYDSRRRRNSDDLHRPNRVVLRGQHLLVTSTALADTHLAYLADPRNQSSIVGVEPTMLAAVAGHYGFSYSMVHPQTTDGLFGVRLDNGSWTGVIGMIVRGEADLAVGDISVTLERSEVVDFTYPFLVEPVSFFMLRPAPLPRWLVIAVPFDSATWLLLLLVLVTALVALPLLPGMLAGRSWRLRLREASAFLWGAMVNQAVSLRPRAAACRLVVVSWWAFCLTMTICYQTLLTSQLSVSLFPPPLDSLTQLALSEHRVLSIQHVAVTEYLESFSGSASVLGRIPPKLSYFPLEESLTELRLEPNTAYLEELAMLRQAVAARPDRHRYYISRARFFATGLAWPVRRGACFRGALDEAVRRLLQAGLVEFWMRDAGADEATVAVAKKSLRLKDLTGAFLLLVTGIALATACLTLEMVWVGQRRKKRGNVWARVVSSSRRDAEEERACS
ncbi:glutamate receptor-like [Pollicipes pollicipes]|nr:glutamate receptor-like [Pollicipes pollicipes]